MYPSLSPVRSLATIVTIVGLLASCTTSSTNLPTASPPTISPASAPAKPKVVATTTVLCDIAKAIAADTIDLTCILKPGVDAHVYEPVPDDRKAIETAQLILYSGYDFEPGLVKLIQSTSNPAPKIAVAEVAVSKPLIGEDDHTEEKSEPENKSAGDPHDHADEPDPHVWHNAQNGARMVEVVEENLAKAVPQQASIYSKNAQGLEAKLTAINTWIKSQIATIPDSQRKLVTTHDAMGYFSAAYGIPVEGALQGLSTDEKPTPTRVKTLVDEIKASGVPTIFAETSVNPKLLAAVAKESNVKIAPQELYADGLGAAGSDGETYPKMLIANTKAIVEGLGGKYTPF
jgi:manganese/iron transport system substrate-binding protein